MNFDANTNLFTDSNTKIASQEETPRTEQSNGRTITPIAEMNSFSENDPKDFNTPGITNKQSLLLPTLTH